jgi:hypothetical protein
MAFCSGFSGIGEQGHLPFRLNLSLFFWFFWIPVLVTLAFASFFLRVLAVYKNRPPSATRSNSVAFADFEDLRCLTVFELCCLNPPQL